MAKLDLEWLAVFDEVYKTGSVSKAAERLGLAQAAASTALNKLRAHFDDRLFARTALGMQPTPHAQTHLPARCARCWRSWSRRAAAAAASSPAGARRRFRICLTDISEVVLLPALLDHLRRAAPGVQIETEIVSNDSARRLEDGEVDLAVGFMPQLDAGFYQQTLFPQNFVCLVARNHPRIGDRLTRKALRGRGACGDLIVGHRPCHRRQDHRAPRHRAPRGGAPVELPGRGAHRGAHRAGGDRAAHPGRDAGARRSRSKLIEPPFALPTYAVKQHWHERFHADAGNAWLRRTIAELMTDAHAP